jgi:predicted transcriptional regulator
MGIFDSIQEEIDARDRRSGITAADLLDLPPRLRRLMNLITRRGPHTAAQAAESLGESVEEVVQTLNGLAEKGYLEREETEEGWVYQTHFARRRGRKLPGGIWSALGQRASEE